MIYFDVRGVSRRYDVELRDDGFTWSRDDAELAQRFRVTIAPDGRSMEGEGTMSKDGRASEPDLCLSYARS
jgi:hypothetical protein